MATLQRELKQIFFEILQKYNMENREAAAEELASAAKEFNFQPQKRGDLVDGLLHYAQNNPAIKYAQVREEFERAFGFNPLPWDGKNRAWGRLERFLFAEHQEDENIIQRVAAHWRGEGRYAMPTKNQIYADPDRLIATWPQDVVGVEYAQPAPLPERPPMTTPEMIERARAKHKEMK